MLGEDGAIGENRYGDVDAIPLLEPGVIVDVDLADLVPATQQLLFHFTTETAARPCIESHLKHLLPRIPSDGYNRLGAKPGVDQLRRDTDSCGTLITVLLPSDGLLTATQLSARAVPAR